MKMYKITPSQRKIEVLEYDGTWDTMRPHLKYDLLDHATLNAAHDKLFVNDEGLFDGSEATDGSFWWLHDNGVWQKFVGEALLWGTHGEDNADPSLSIDQVRARISYIKPPGAQEPRLEPVITTFDSLDDMLNHLAGGSGDED